MCGRKFRVQGNGFAVKFGAVPERVLVPTFQREGAIGLPIEVPGIQIGDRAPPDQLELGPGELGFESRDDGGRDFVLNFKLFAGGTIEALGPQVTATFGFD